MKFTRRNSRKTRNVGPPCFPRRGSYPKHLYSEQFKPGTRKAVAYPIRKSLSWRQNDRNRRSCGFTRFINARAFPRTRKHPNFSALQRFTYVTFPRGERKRGETGRTEVSRFLEIAIFPGHAGSAVGIDPFPVFNFLNMHAGSFDNEYTTLYTGTPYRERKRRLTRSLNASGRYILRFHNSRSLSLLFLFSFLPNGKTRDFLAHQ